MVHPPEVTYSCRIRDLYVTVLSRCSPLSVAATGYGDGLDEIAESPLRYGHAEKPLVYGRKSVPWL